jgi:hypothetical protein
MEISDEILPFRSWCNEMLNVMNKTMCLEMCSGQYEPIHSNISTPFATHRIDIFVNCNWVVTWWQ